MPPRGGPTFRLGGSNYASNNQRNTHSLNSRDFESKLDKSAGIGKSNEPSS
jgi:hypothetical protein